MNEIYLELDCIKHCCDADCEPKLDELAAACVGDKDNGPIDVGDVWWWWWENVGIADIEPQL